jgi:CheY-like chemotaxis protein
MTTRIRLIHWKEPEALERASILQQAGYEVDARLANPALLKELRQSPPAAVIIDLTRLPSQGRDVAVQLRGFKSMRAVPFVFIEGEADKTNRVRELLPDSVFTSWENVLEDLKGTLEHPPILSTIPTSSFAAYAGAPVCQKLGIKPGSMVGMVDAPDDFNRSLGQVPEGAILQDHADLGCTLVLWFVRSSQTLEEQIGQMRDMTGKDGLWILWPKLGSGITTDVSQTLVRNTGLANGLVDYKICAVDATWSGLRFAKRKARDHPED